MPSSRAVASRAAYSVELVPGFVLLVDHNVGTSITNDAENVIADLVREGVLGRGTRVLYRDTLGRWDELLRDGVRFIKFSLLGGVDAEDAIRRAREGGR